ncbi:MAG: hypothetical protein K0Q95_845 [Bacteroidota bacterium]|jgi:hypothetical protein|nr:hypothetical protein [Bacteroidota bacterium]
MRLSEFKTKLNSLENVSFLQVDGLPVPAHFHITEVGVTTKNFIDCGGTIREEKLVNFQLWEANDTHHRLTAKKLSGIIELCENKLGIADMEVEVEYQTNTIGRYGVEYKDDQFKLVPKFTNCLASDSCGIPKEKVKLNLSELSSPATCCSPGGGCC